ncbi:MAG: divergent PAP2 family protein [Lachnospiraceae bacterium]|nr:divergent PAP2 family protein [Lachnospiraceae bacterium]
MKYLQLLADNKLFSAAVCGWAAAQIIKTLIDLMLNKKLSLERLVGSGGMPSAHSATVCALSTAAGMIYGLDSPIFAVSAIIAIIVMYDARGVRRETGTQAEVLNKIMHYFSSEHPEKITFDQEKLKEFIGHTPLQVTVGGLLGITVAVIFCLFL